MGGINLGRVILGGFVAGIIFNVSEFLLNEKVLRADMEAAMKALGKAPADSASAITVWVILGFVQGFFAVALYAVARARFGAGPGFGCRGGDAPGCNARGCTKAAGRRPIAPGN